MEGFECHLCRLSAPWIPASAGNTRWVAGMTKWGRRVDVGGGIALGVLSRDVSTWILAPYWGTGQAFDRENDEAEDKKDELGSDSTGATYFRTDDEVGGRYDVASGGNLF